MVKSESTTTTMRVPRLMCVRVCACVCMCVGLQRWTVSMFVHCYWVPLSGQNKQTWKPEKVPVP